MKGTGRVKHKYLTYLFKFEITEWEVDKRGVGTLVASEVNYVLRYAPISLR